MADTIWVKSGRDDDRVVLWEVSPEHPADDFGQHEAFVAGKDSAPVEVATTPRVNQLVRDGELVEVSAPAADAKAAPAKTATTTTTAAPAEAAKA